jgi:hypothetical protein
MSTGPSSIQGNLSGAGTESTWVVDYPPDLEASATYSVNFFRVRRSADMAGQIRSHKQYGLGEIIWISGPA